MQSLNGGWWDFPVSVGSSGPWVTGVVGEILNGLPEALRSPVLEERLGNAATYLRLARHPEGGWGYNEALPADCDSTAHAIIFLQSRRADIDDASVRCLQAFQDPDGAFLTYTGAPAGHSWGSVHHDVHGPAVQALARLLGPCAPAVQLGLRRIIAALDADPIWPAFWWKPQIYGIYVNLRCLDELGVLDSVTAPPAHLRVTEDSDTPLSMALSGMIALWLGRAPLAHELAMTLIRSQRPDGGWPTSPALRVTDPACLEPWREADEKIAGRLYRDTRQIFTTAIALKLLAALSVNPS